MRYPLCYLLTWRFQIKQRESEKQALQTLFMKQELDLSTLLEPSDSHSAKSSPAARKRPIKKDPAAIELIKMKKLAREAKRKLSKEDKMKLQKEKNRFHAQKSRDEHKEYVSSLEREITSLREELERARHYCCNCKLPIGPAQQAEPVQPPNLQHFNGDEITWKQEGFTLEEEVASKGDTSFLRLFEEKEDHHLLKMVLFVVAIVLAVLFVNGPHMQHAPKGIIPLQTYSISENIEDSTIEQPHQNETLHHSQIQPRITEHGQGLNSNLMNQSKAKQGPQAKYQMNDLGQTAQSLPLNQAHRIETEEKEVLLRVPPFQSKSVSD